MPIFDNGRTIFIAHPIAGKFPETQQLGHCSTELAFWLRLRNQYEKARLDTEPDIAVTERLQRQILTNQHTQDWNTRSVQSGLRGYKPQLCNETGKLTIYGKELANYAQTVYSALLYECANIRVDVPDPTNPDNFKKADDCFITADISIRVFKLLQIITQAIDEAEIRHAEQNIQTNSRLHLQYIADFFNNEAELSKKVRMQEGRIKGQKSKRFSIDNVPDASDLIRGPEITDLDPLYMMQSQIRAIDITNDAYVPTGSFGQRARSDLRVLFKYGLVDLRTYSLGGRGRPPHIIRTSVTGRIVVKDLEKQGYLSSGPQSDVLE